MGGNGNRAVLTLHKCLNAAMIFLKVLFVYNIFHIFEYRFGFWSPANLFSPSFGDSQHQGQLTMPGWSKAKGLSGKPITVVF